jgi:hypothetical protein
MFAEITVKKETDGIGYTVYVAEVTYDCGYSSYKAYGLSPGDALANLGYFIDAHKEKWE